MFWILFSKTEEYDSDVCNCKTNQRRNPFHLILIAQEIRKRKEKTGQIGMKYIAGKREGKKTNSNRMLVINQ
jgi:hypothetical protein